MDDFELVRSLYGEAPPSDPVARARALRALRRAATPRWPRRNALAAAAIALVALAAAITLSLVRTSGNDAVDQLRRLSGIAGGQEGELAVGGRPVVYELSQASEIRSGFDVETGEGFFVEARTRNETWRSSDGSVFRISEVLSVRFPSDAARAAWASAVASGDGSMPQVGELDEVNIPAGRIPFPDLAELPLEPDDLLQRLRTGWWPEPLGGDEETLRAIAELLARGDATSELREALFEAGSTLEDIELLGDRTDPLNREGVAIGLGPADRRVVLVVDPDTSFLLSLEERSGELTTWRAYQAWATVDSPGERPADDLS